MGDTHFVEGLIRDFRVRVLDLELIINALKERHVIQSFSELDIAFSNNVFFTTESLTLALKQALLSLLVSIEFKPDVSVK